MKTYHISIILILVSTSLLSQNVGINQSNPQNSLHITPIGTNDPLRVDNVNDFQLDDSSILVINPVNGVVRKMNITDLINTITSNNLFISNITSDSTFIDSLLANNYFKDSIYAFISDSLLNDTSWINELKDSIDSDVSEVILNGSNIYIIEDGDSVFTNLAALALDSSFADSLLSNQYFTDSIFTLNRDSLLGDQYFLDSMFTFNRDSLINNQLFLDSMFSFTRDSLLGDSTFINDLASDSSFINTLTSDSLFLSNIASDSNFIDSLLGNNYFTDSMYAMISDSLLNDTNWINNLKDSIDSDVERVEIYGSDIYIIEDGDSITTDLAVLALDSSFADSLLSNQYFTDSIFTLNRDSLLEDQYFLDSMFTFNRDSLINDKSFLDSMFSFTRDSLLGDSIFINNLASDSSFINTLTSDSLFLGNIASDSSFVDSLLSNDYFTDSIYRMVRDSLLNDTSWISELKDSILNAENGIHIDPSDDKIKLGGALTENTTIAQANFGMAYNLSGTGDFLIQDNGTNKFELRDNGNTFFGGDVSFKDGNTGGTDLVTIIDEGDDGRLRVYENGAVSIDLDANGTTIFNQQGLDRDFRVESTNTSNIIRTDAANDRVGIHTGSPTNTLDVNGTARIRTMPAASIVDSIILKDNSGELHQMSFSRFAQYMKDSFGLGNTSPTPPISFPNKVTYTHTGADQSLDLSTLAFADPSNPWIKVKIWGAAGGSRNFTSLAGGCGGYTEFMMPLDGSISVNGVVIDQTTVLRVMVGQVGGSVASPNGGTPRTTADNYGYGGNGACDGAGSNATVVYGGGGLSGLFVGTGAITNTDAINSLVVSGGGSGAGESTPLTRGKCGNEPTEGGEANMKGIDKIPAVNSDRGFGGGGGGYTGGSSISTGADQAEGGQSFIHPGVFNTTIQNGISPQQLPPNASDSDRPATVGELVVGGFTFSGATTYAAGGNGAIVILFN